MKIEKLNMIQYLLKSLFLMVLLVLCSPLTGQTLQRQCIGSGGNCIVSNGLLIQQTVGQPYSTGTSYSDGVSYRPGFQQPIIKVDLIKSNIKLDVFPNPAANWVTIKSSKTLTDAQIRIVEMSGKLLVEEKIAEFKTYSFNCESWINGTYIISLFDTKGNSYSAKLIILK